jgi:ADP-ribose pyrophosphatase YjhB (NUDIX family)
MSDVLAADGEEFRVHSNGQDWIASWHPSVSGPPAGKPHGAAAVCFIGDGQIVLVTEDGKSWGLPGGRPEGDEDWRETLDREVLEEACARVDDATLLGFSKGVCIRGEEEGLVLVRSFWLAAVSLEAWAPEYEITQRRLTAPEIALDLVSQADDVRPIYQRLFHEAFIRRGIQ